MVFDLVRLLLFPALMAFAAASDLFTMTISNRVSLLLVLGFAVLAAAGGMGLYDVLLHLGAAGAVLAVTFFCFAMGWMGGGDAKMASAIALWFGFAHLLDFLLYASVFGGALTLLLIEFRRWPYPMCLPANPGCSGCTTTRRVSPTVLPSRSARSSFTRIPPGSRWSISPVSSRADEAQETPR